MTESQILEVIHSLSSDHDFTLRSRAGTNEVYAAFTFNPYRHRDSMNKPIYAIESTIEAAVLKAASRAKSESPL